MGWYETFKNIFLIIVLFEVIVNYSYYKSTPVFNSDPKQIYQFKSIWHKRLNRFVTYLFIIYVIVMIIHWV